MKKIFLSFIFCLFAQVVHAGTPDIFTARGLTSQGADRAQENSLDAFIAIKKWNETHRGTLDEIKGAEVSLIVTNPPAPNETAFVCEHDENLFELTDANINIRNLTKERINALQLKQVLNGIDYGKPRPLAYFEQVLDAVMRDTPYTLWLGVKDRNYRPTDGTSHTAVALIDALDKWHTQYLRERNIDIFQYILISSTNPFIVDALDKESKKRGLDKQGLNIFPDYSNLSAPPVAWNIFLDVMGGYEKLFHLSTRWVSLEKNMVTPARIKKYHDQHIKIIGWGFDSRNDSYANQMDVLLLSY